MRLTALAHCPNDPVRQGHHIRFIFNWAASTSAGVAPYMAMRPGTWRARGAASRQDGRLVGTRVPGSTTLLWTSRRW